MTELPTLEPSTTPDRTWNKVAAAVVLVATGLSVAGVFLPWLSYYAGLQQLSGFGTPNGDRLLVLAAASLALAVGTLARPRSYLRWAIVGLGAGEALFSFHLITTLGSLATGSGMLVVRGGPGPYLALAAGLAMVATVFIPRRTSARATGAGWLAAAPGELA
jgi:hypothetical protein